MSGYVAFFAFFAWLTQHTQLITEIRREVNTKMQFDDEHNVYGVQFLVDFKPIEVADQLLMECDKFVQESKAEALVPYVPPFAIIANNIRSWRMRRRESRLSTTYSALQPRIALCEKTLRTIIGEVVEKKAILRLQAKQLLVRLDECVRHNRELLRCTDVPLEETRTFVNVLSSEAVVLKSMVNFNREILRLRHAQEMNRSPALLRWGMQKARAVADVDISKDDDHHVIEEKLLKFRELKQKFVDSLGAVLEKRGVQQSNLDNCLWSLEAIRAAIKRDGVSRDHDDDCSSAESAEPLTFDHSRCVDCSYGYSITCECMSHLSTLQKQAQDANKRLQALVEIRERMMEASELMNQQTDPCPPNPTADRHGSSFSSVGSPEVEPRRDRSSKSLRDHT